VFIMNEREQKLMAIGDPRLGSEIWHVVQHEGFHQFACAVIGGDLPIWVNEGLAEYFGESIWTGDGYVTGVVPPPRLARIQNWIKGGKTASIKGMMELPHEAWNANLSLVNYDQAWSMVYFLAHSPGEKGKLIQDAFNGFIRDVSQRMAWEQAWKKNFGTGVREFEQQWKAYWTGMTPDHSKVLYARGCVATLSSFYGRAASQKQFFETADAFFDAARDGRLKSASADWLPPALLERELKHYEKIGGWSVYRAGTRNELHCKLPDGTLLMGSFQVTSSGHIKDGSVHVTVKEPKGKK
jgi:hypothetical protein